MFHKDLSPSSVSQWVPRKPSSWITYQPLTESAVLFRKNDENWPYRMIPSMGSLVSCSWPPSHLDSDGNKQKLAWALAGHHLPINNLGFQGVFVPSKTTCERSLFSTPISEISKVTTLHCLSPKGFPESRSNCWTPGWSFCQVLGRKFCRILDHLQHGQRLIETTEDFMTPWFFLNSESSRLLFHLAMLHQRSPWT